MLFNYSKKLPDLKLCSFCYLFYELSPNIKMWESDFGNILLVFHKVQRVRQAEKFCCKNILKSEKTGIIITNLSFIDLHQFHAIYYLFF